MAPTDIHTPFIWIQRLLCSCFLIQVSRAASASASSSTDTIIEGRSLSFSKTITSSGQVFELGFFSPQNSTNIYLGIWYKKIEPRTVVWVGNRVQPLTSSAPYLTLDQGNLVIVDDRVTYRVSSLSSGRNTSLVLLDSGNLVLRDGSSSDIIWQSFDDPTDTFPPWMKIGVDKRHVAKIVATAVAPFVLLSLAISLYYYWKMKRNRTREEAEGMLLFGVDMMGTSAEVSEDSADQDNRSAKSKDSLLQRFSFMSVSVATDNFSLKNKLGEGGFGPVYKGKLLNGQEVAVKRLSRKSGKGLQELRNETTLTARLQHRNLVRILGCCLEKDENILIYELMSNRNLDLFLFDPSKRGLLDWTARAHIIEGTAQGLLYLHKHSRLRIIHRDPKASNILLDKDMNPKISDFGIAKMFGGNESQANTSHIVGTYGYMSPEYALEGICSIKSDVFSFGVLLLEIISGKKNTGFYQTDSLNLLSYAWELWSGATALQLVDPALKDRCSDDTVTRYINIAFLCVDEIAGNRPTMSEVVPC